MDRAHGKPCRYRALYALLALCVVAGVLAAGYAETELKRGVKNVADALDGIVDLLENLQAITSDMAGARAGPPSRGGRRERAPRGPRSTRAEGTARRR